jgi:hypothetical protein
MDMHIPNVLKQFARMPLQRLQVSEEHKQGLHEAMQSFKQAAKNMGNAVENVILDQVKPPPAELAKSNGKGEHHEKESTPIEPK